MYQAPMSLKEIIVNRLRNYFFLNIMQHPKTKNFVRKIDVRCDCYSSVLSLFSFSANSVSKSGV